MSFWGVGVDTRGRTLEVSLPESVLSFHQLVPLATEPSCQSRASFHVLSEAGQVFRLSERYHLEGSEGKTG